MSMEIKHIDLSDRTALDRFLAIGESIRNGSQKIEIPWSESGQVEQLIEDSDRHIFALIGSNEDHIGRLLAYGTKGQDQAYIGWYECDDDAGLAKSLLSEAIFKLKELGYKSVEGPINGSTWYNYRLNLSSDHPLAPGDPYQPLYYVDQWKTAGFDPKHGYVTEIAPKNAFKPMTREEVEAMLSANGITLHTFPEQTDEDLLKAHYEFYNTCFTSNPGFTPITFDEFAALSVKSNSICNREHSFYLNDQNGAPIFVIVCFNDVYHEAYKAGQLQHESYATNKLLIKTLATHPEWQGKQIGTLMVNLVHNLGTANGYDEIYHLLMYENNLSSTKGHEKFKTERAGSYCTMEKWI